MIAPGAEPIRQARLAGKMPDELIIVSLVGPLDESNRVVIAHPAMTYDWRMMRGLQVCVFAKQRTPLRKTVRDIGCKLPAKLFLWDVDAKEGADCIVCLTDKGMDKIRHDAGDVEVIYWPWTAYENKQFEGKV